MFETKDILIFLIIFLIGLVTNVNTSHFYGVQLAVDLVQNTSEGNVTVNFHWREIWNATTPLSTISPVRTCATGSICPSGPSPLTMSAGTANCQQIVTSASGVSYDSRTGVDTSTYFPSGSIPLTTQYYSMAFSSNAWGLIQNTVANFGAQIDVLISRRVDTLMFDSSARSAIAPIVTIRPACGGYGFQIPTYDPDGDTVQCRWGNTTLECQSVCNNSYNFPIPFILSTGCYLTYIGGLPASKIYYPIAVMLDDYYPSMPTIKMDSAPLQFVVEVALPTSPCVPVTPLVVDSCSLSLAPLSECPSNITNAPANSYVSSYYTVTANSTANLTCNYGYAPMPTAQIYMICSPYNDTASVWSAVGNCKGTRTSNFYTAQARPGQVKYLKYLKFQKNQEIF